MIRGLVTSAPPGAAGLREAIPVTAITVSSPQPRTSSRACVADDHLGQARAVAQDQECDRAQEPATVHPALEPDRLAGALRQVGREGTGRPVSDADVMIFTSSSA